MLTKPRPTRLRGWLLSLRVPSRFVRRKRSYCFSSSPKGDLTEEFECWAIHHFAHVTEEGDEEDVFTSSRDGGSNNSGGVGVAQPNPNITRTPTQHNPEDAPTNETVPTEVLHLFESNTSTLDSDDADLVRQILPGMVDNDNQPLPENIPTPAEEAQDAPQFFSNWEHSGDCYCCLAGGRKHKACLSLYTDVKPTIQQLFEMFFFKQYVEGIINHPSNKSMLVKRKTSSYPLWRVPSLAGLVVPHVNNQQSRSQ